MYSERVDLYKKIEKEYKTRLLVYITGSRQGAEMEIGLDAIDSIVTQLDNIRRDAKLSDGARIEDLSLFLYTLGGDVYAALSILNLLKTYCNKLRVIIPRRAQSSGTLISIGADEIVMTKQATLGPIDPSVMTEFNPRGTADNIPQRIRVEDVEGYIKFSKEELGLGKDDATPVDVLMKLTDIISPICLGRVYRTRKRIRELGTILLDNKVKDKDRLKSLVDYLCGDSGDHFYMINRYETEEMGLDITEPSQKQYEIIEAIYKDISNELKFNQPRILSQKVENENLRRGLIESIAGGSDYFCTEVVAEKIDNGKGGDEISRAIKFSGWKHDGLTSVAD